MAVSKVTQCVIMTIIDVVSKCIAFLSYVFLAIASIVFISVGGGILAFIARYKHALVETNVSFPAYILLGTGILLILAGAAGVLACIKHSRCLLVFFYSLLLLILLCELAVVIVSIFYWPKVSRQVSQMLEEQLNIYDKLDVPDRVVDIIQSNLHCCGVNNWSDWESTNFYKATKNYPQSCYEDPNNKETELYQTGCVVALGSEVQRHLAYIIGSGCIFFLLQLLSLHSTCIVVCRSRAIHLWR
uniref:Tetraspanin n=2 Tax=Trichobilharzia regenti TaxID=157069 RepID=A0AA85JPV8_TRIRE